MLSRVVRIVEAFGSETPALRVSEIARRADLHVATASRLIEELVGYGWLRKEADRRVRIGVRLWELASRASPTLGLREAAMPFLEDLHAVVGHHVQLGVREEREALFVERLSAPGAVINLTRIAGRLPLHASSSGVVLLAHAPGRLQEQVLAGPLHAYTPRTVVDPGELRAMLADVRKGGVALCRGFIDTRATGVAVPLRDSENTVIAALSVIVPNDDNARMHIPALQAAARGISRAAGVQDPQGVPRHFSH
ncbi:DNA-binding IclR family transcriptional regulator [Saccharopolyspora lacisalsi]|uniref:DNA-binding IclR family transcriptional regulator n=1 Tax=Halosaccharopolyspora lacisalsi TaxID=1000566 RepID=A0A839E476_9PSEU|nr:DNA-binding IclR family transcriptional regulator [Halosaccharopolyspora lacisalsi]